MNLLPFIVSLLAAFGVLTYYSIQESKMSLHILSRAQQYLELQEETFNKTMLYRVKQEKKNLRAPKEQKESPSKPHKKSPFKSRRIHECLNGNAKLSLTNYFKKKDAGKEFLKSFLIRYLQSFYPNTNLEPFINEMLLKTENHLKQHPKTDSLAPSDLSDISPELFSLIRGTKCYVLNDKEGGPPLSDLIILYENKDRGPISSKYASYPLLCALVGQKGANLIIEEEKKRYYEEGGSYHFDKKKIEELLSLHRIILPDQTQIFNLIDDKHCHYGKIEIRVKNEVHRTEESSYVFKNPPKEVETLT